MTAPPMARQSFRATESIPGIARKGDLIVVNSENPGIAVGRWVPWSELATIMKHTEAEQDDYSVNDRPNHLQLMD